MTKLNEGLIAIPPNLQRSVYRYVAEQILWMLRDKFTPSMKKEYPDHFKAVQRKVKEFGIKLPKEKFVIPSNGITLKQIPFDFSDMPKQYEKLTPDRDFFVVAMSYEKQNDNSVAAYWNRENKHKLDQNGNPRKEAILLVYVAQIRDLSQYPAYKSSPDEIDYIFNILFSSLKHELRHFVQYVLIAPKDATQVKTNPKYKEHGVDYYTSQVELDPMIGSAVETFIEMFNIVQKHNKPNLKKSIKQFVGLLPSKSYEVFSCDSLFKHLKNDPAKYRIAVNKFLKALDIALKEQIK